MRSDGTELMFGARRVSPLSEITKQITVNLSYPFTVSIYRKKYLFQQTDLCWSSDS